MHNYGVVDLTRLLTKSSNVGVAKIVAKLTNAARSTSSSRRFGFGARPAAASRANRPGVLPPPDALERHEKATMSYGYGLSVTPLQLAQAYAALGNGGQLLAPTFVKGAAARASAGARSGDRRRSACA